MLNPIRHRALISKLRPMPWGLDSVTPGLISFSLGLALSCFSLFASSIIFLLCSSSILNFGNGSSPLPERVWLTKAWLLPFSREPIDVVDFIFLSPRMLLFASLFWVVEARWSESVFDRALLNESSLTSLRVRRFRNSRAILSRVVPRFFGVMGGTVCDLFK